MPSALLVPGPDARRSHYGEFYGLRPLPGADRAVVVVWGNCQAESLRVLLDGAPGVASVRVPPVHEITAEDLPHLARLLPQVTHLVSQPVAPGWRGLPLGTGEIAALARRPVPVVRFPVIRYAGLYPFQVIVRAGGEPPVVPYHDLRTLAAAAGNPLPPLSGDAVRAVAAHSLGELRRREERHGTVLVSDLLTPAGAGAAHTVNHPGNGVLRGLAARVREALKVPGDVPDPGRVLLRSVLTPQRADVLDALGLDAPPRPDWSVEGVTVPDAEVRDRQAAWYREHPEVVRAGVERHHEVLGLLAAS